MSDAPDYRPKSRKDQAENGPFDAYLRFAPLVLLALSVIMPATVRHTGFIMSSSDAGAFFWIVGLLEIGRSNSALFYLLLPIGALLLPLKFDLAAAFTGLVSVILIAIYLTTEFSPLSEAPLGVAVHTLLVLASAILLPVLGLALRSQKRR